MTLSKAGILIRKSNKIGKAAALYVCDGQGKLMRQDYATAREARQIAADLSKQTSWRVSEDLSREGTGDEFSLSASRPHPTARSAAGSLVSQLRSSTKRDR